MRKVLYALVVIFICACSKEDGKNWATGTVVEKGGCFNDSWLVYVDNWETTKFNFLCDNSVPRVGENSCVHSVFIKLPAHLAVAGTKISFIAKEVVPSCYSWNMAPNHLEVHHVVKR